MNSSYPHQYVTADMSSTSLTRSGASLSPTNRSGMDMPLQSCWNMSAHTDCVLKGLGMRRSTSSTDDSSGGDDKAAASSCCCLVETERLRWRFLSFFFFCLSGG